MVLAPAWACLKVQQRGRGGGSIAIRLSIRTSAWLAISGPASASPIHTNAFNQAVVMGVAKLKPIRAASPGFLKLRFWTEPGQGNAAPDSSGSRLYREIRSEIDP